MREARCRHSPFRRLLVAAAIVSIVLGMIASTATIAAAACTGDNSGSGFATSYSYTPGSGACSYGDDFGSFVAAINPTDYAGSEMCGRCLRVTGPLGSVNARVVDLCPTCATGDVAMNAAALGTIANPADGRVAITSTTIAAPVSGHGFLQISTRTRPPGTRRSR